MGCWLQAYRDVGRAPAFGIQKILASVRKGQMVGAIRIAQRRAFSPLIRNSKREKQSSGIEYPNRDKSHLAYE